MKPKVTHADWCDQYARDEKRIARILRVSLRFLQNHEAGHAERFIAGLMRSYAQDAVKAAKRAALRRESTEVVK